MIGRDFVNRLANGMADLIQAVLDSFAETRSRYCLIGGLAVNAYVEPVVSLDLDIDILRLVERYPELELRLPTGVGNELDER